MEFIKNAGACLATTNVLEGRGKVRWMVRGESNAPADNGWQILSDIDDAAYLNDPSSWQIVDFNELCAIEPALISIWNLPVGSDLGLVRDPQHGMVIVDNKTGYAVPKEELYVPEAPADDAPAAGGPDFERAQQLAGEILTDLAQIMPDGWEEVIGKASVVGSRSEFMVWVRFGKDDWRIMPPRDEYFIPKVLEFRDASYDPVEGAWFVATWRAEPTGRGSLNTDTESQPPFSDPVPANEFAADLQRYPRAAEHTPQWLRELL